MAQSQGGQAVSNTPLTDMLLISWDMDVPSYVMTRHARFIELKLNAANERIKRLEQENDAMRADLLLWREQEVKP
jgi:hypothetical protein